MVALGIGKLAEVASTKVQTIRYYVTPISVPFIIADTPSLPAAVLEVWLP